MNSKMLLAFVGGLIVASGVTFIAMKRTGPVPQESVAQANVPPAVTATPGVKPPPAAEEPTPAESPATAAAPEPQAAHRFERVKVRPAPVQRAAVRPLPSRTTPQPAPPVQSAPVPVPSAQQASAPAPVQETAKVEPPARAYETPTLPPPPPQPATVTIPTGTTLTVRLSETLSSERNQPGDQFTAVLDQPLVVDGFVLAERGARVRGRIVELDRSGRVRGLAKMAIELTQLKTSDGQNLKINTSAFTKQAESTRNKDATKVGAGAAIGAVIGAIAGGGKGAAIGAGVGGAAGAGDVAMTRGQAAELRVETRVSFRLSEAVTVTERVQ